MENRKNDKIIRYAAITVITVGVAFGLYLVLKYALTIILPFFLAFLIGLLVKRPAEYISAKTKIPRAVSGAVLTVVFLGLVSCLTVFALDRLMNEATRLIMSLSSEGGGEIGRMLGEVFDYISNISSRLPVLRELRDVTGNEEFWSSVDTSVVDMIRNAAKELTARIPEFIGRAAFALPSVFVGAVVTLIAAFYFSSGDGARQIGGILPEKVRNKISEMTKRMKPALIGWLRAYLTVMLLTFVELFVGLSLLRVKYAFMIALAVALVDILPVLGTGTVLLPWAAVSFIMGNYFLGVGLLVLYVTATLVHEIIEPRLVGKSIGVPPLVTLIAMYAGLRLFGFFGMIAAPAAAVLLKAALVKDGKPVK